jgi:hypothetical protein
MPCNCMTDCAPPSETKAAGYVSRNRITLADWVCLSAGVCQPVDPTQGQDPVCAVTMCKRVKSPHGRAETVFDDQVTVCAQLMWAEVPCTIQMVRRHATLATLFLFRGTGLQFTPTTSVTLHLRCYARRLVDKNEMWRDLQHPFHQLLPSD